MNYKKISYKLKICKHLIVRCLVLYFVCSSFFSCKTGANINSSTLINNPESWCPEDGICTMEVLTNSSLEYNYDRFGMAFVKIEEGDNTILKFEYKRKSNLDVADASYREEVFIALGSNQIEIETENFKRVQVIFGRWCFCKGQAGNYRVSNGSLSIKRVKDSIYKMNFSFKVEEVPQVIANINHKFTLP